ncbi:MAG: DUF2959 domain-containing protein [Planctomycetes bacterium]|nr:DUF2959 domain-containing protein [Planctomycetota bacterium]
MRSFPFIASLALVVSAGCQSAYYGVMEKFGVEKRDILVDRVEEGRDAQKDAKQQFQSALDAFKSVTDFDGGELEEQYEHLKSEYDDTSDRVDDVGDKLESIESVATDLFAEWKAEIDQISSADLEAQSRKLLADTKKRYGDLMAAMKKAEAKMQPVLVAFNDRVLFLKHNLNAQAIASLSNQVGEIDGKVQELVRDMEASIAEADAFIAAMDSAN